jgi:hypothetical protein
MADTNTENKDLSTENGTDASLKPASPSVEPKSPKKHKKKSSSEEDKKKDGDDKKNDEKNNDDEKQKKEDSPPEKKENGSDDKTKEYFEKQRYLDFERQWGRIESGLKLEENSLKHIKSALTYLEDAVNGTYQGDYETFVVKTAIGGCIASILQNKEMNGPERALANDFLQKSLMFVMKHIDGEHRAALVHILNRYFHKFPWYNKPSKEDIPDIVKKLYLSESEEDKIFAKLPKGEHLTSLYYVANINFFGQNGGWDALIEKLNEPNLTMFYMKMFLKPIATVKDYFLPSYLKVIVPKIQKSIFDQMLKYTGQELSVK